MRTCGCARGEANGRKKRIGRTETCAAHEGHRRRRRRCRCHGSSRLYLSSLIRLRESELFFRICLQLTSASSVCLRAISSVAPANGRTAAGKLPVATSTRNSGHLFQRPMLFENYVAIGVEASRRTLTASEIRKSKPRREEGIECINRRRMCKIPTQTSV